MTAMAGGVMVHMGERVRGGASLFVGQKTASSLSASRMSFGAAGRVRMGAGSRPGVFCSVGMNGARSVEAKSPPITFHVGETSFTMPFSPAAAKGLNEAINSLFQTFKEREGAARLQRWKTMEFRQTGEDGVFFEVFCNPNAYSNAFQAKVLITINDEKIKIASEGQLSALKADIDDYVAQHV